MPHIRIARFADCAGIAALQSACFPPPFPDELLWKSNHIAKHIDIFPNGQWVAECDNRIVASCSNMLVSSEIWQSHLPWEQVTGGMNLINHRPTGTVMYGIDISVHPNNRGQGIARKLYQTRIAECSQNGWTFGTVCRIPGFADSGYPDPKFYVERVISGFLTDPTLTPLIRIGLKVQGIIPEYMVDQKSGNTGVILEWQ